MKALDLKTWWQNRQTRRLLDYPDDVNSAVRWVELKTHGIKTVYSFGPKHLQGLDILGLGYCGVVLLVQGEPLQPLVLKIRRANAPQPDFRNEAQALTLANQVGVGPRLVSWSDNFLLMGYAQGPKLADWLHQMPRLSDVRTILRSLIDQAHRLDVLGLDHGALRCITDHAIVTSQGPVLLDFSGASRARRPANVTTLVQGLWISTVLAKLLAPLFPKVEKATLIDYLRCYKQQCTHDNLLRLYHYLGL